MKSFINNQKGQALLFVVVAMAVALALGINISLRTLSSVSRISRTDTSERVLSAAEGASEAFLRLSPNTLDLIATNPSTNCSSAGAGVAYDSTKGACVIQYMGQATDEIDAIAYVTVDDNVVINPYTFTFGNGEVAEISLEGVGNSTTTICYRPVNGHTANTALYYLAYGNDTNGNLGPLANGGVQSASNSNRTGFTTGALDGDGYSCRNLVLSGAPYALRLRALGDDMNVKVSNANLPSQGYWVNVTAELVQSGDIKETKVLRVFKSYPFLPGVYDFGVYSDTGGFDTYN